MPANSPARLVTTPPNPPLLNSEKFQIDATIDSQGTLDGKTRFEERGDPEVLLRLAYRNTPQNQWKDLTQVISGRMGFAGTVSQVAAAQPEKTAEPFWVTYDYHRTDYSDWKENRIGLPFPPMFLPELNEAQKKSKDALPLGSPQEFYYETSLKLPPGIQPVPPPNVEQKNDFAEYTANYRFENGVLHGTRRLTVKVREVPGTQRAAYSAFVKAIRDDTQRWIFLAGNFDQDNPIFKGRALLREGKTADAVTLLEKAAAEDNGNQLLAFALGAAYLRVPDEAKAAVQFEKLLAGKPSARMLNAVAYEYANSNRRLSEAVDYASRAVAETSSQTMNAKLDSSTSDDFLNMSALAAEWDTLGWARFRSGDTASAEKYIQSAWSLNQIAVIGEHLTESTKSSARSAMRITSAVWLLLRRVLQASPIPRKNFSPPKSEWGSQSRNPVLLTPDHFVHLRCRNFLTCAPFTSRESSNSLQIRKPPQKSPCSPSPSKMAEALPRRGW